MAQPPPFPLTETAKPPVLKTLAAFAIIYFVWGSTFLAIRIGVHQVPPLLFAAMRFTAAGVFLLGWAALRREKAPTRREWTSIAVLGVLVFVVDYGLLFWAERRVPSGIAAVLRATIPSFTVAAEILLLRTQKLTVRLSVALLIGLGGVAVLMGRSLHLGTGVVDKPGAVAVIGGALSRAIALVLTRKLVLPASHIVSSGAQMLVGGVLLSGGAALSGELRGFHPEAVSLAAWICLLYLIFAGSILGFTAYLWLIHHESPTRVGTYAYVNPLVAVLLGYFFAGEALGLRTALGTLCVLVSVVVVMAVGRRNAARPAVTKAAQTRPVS